MKKLVRRVTRGSGYIVTPSPCSRIMGLLKLLKSQFLCHLLICYVFLVSGIIINLLQICTSPLWLVSKQLARRINIRLGYCISSREYYSYPLTHR